VCVRVRVCVCVCVCACVCVYVSRGKEYGGNTATKNSSIPISFNKRRRAHTPYTRTHIHTCTHKHTNTKIHKYTNTHAHTHTYTHLPTHIHVHLHIRRRKHKRTYTRMKKIIYRERFHELHIHAVQHQHCVETHRTAEDGC